MCSESCLGFVRYILSEREVALRDILEVGSRDVNGSAREIVLSLQPLRYLGVDLVAGPGVDQVCPAEKLIATFGERRFDGVLCLETLEHVGDWRVVVHNLKHVLRPGGWLVLTTRSPGFPYHEHPIDHWRFTMRDLHTIFSDFMLEGLYDDPREPGVFLKAHRPRTFLERDLSTYLVHEIVPGTYGRLG